MALACRNLLDGCGLCCRLSMMLIPRRYLMALASHAGSEGFTPNPTYEEVVQV